MIIQDDLHPFVKASICAWNEIGMTNKLVGSYLGNDTFTEKDFKLLRLNLFLMFELVNEDIEYELNSIYKNISIKEAYSCIVSELSRHQISIRFVRTRLKDDVNTTKDIRHIILKVTKELMRFFETVELMYDRYPLLPRGTAFKEKILAIFEETQKTICVLRDKCIDELKDCEVVVNTLEHSFKKCFDRRNRYEEQKSDESSFTLND